MDHIGNSPKQLAGSKSGAQLLAEPNEINRLSPWEIDFRQIEPGPMETKVFQRSGELITLLEISMSRAVHQTGASPKGTLSVGLIHPNTLETWQGKDLSSTEMVTFGNTDPFDGVSRASFHGITLSIAQTEVERIAEAVGLGIPELLWNSGTPQIAAPGQSPGNMRQAANRLLGNVHSEMTRADEEEIILALLLSANTDPQTAHKSSPHKRARALNTALAFMVEHQHENLPISEICEMSGTSWRTLDRAFKDKFGFGPKSYYLRVRLNRARSRICAGPEHLRISDVANEYGFWHLGEFARDYRNMFGELPSQTKANGTV
ncbi:helix-turn-helix domain-containing protein [Shimia sp.]|uniref:AraC family transcriptional regulator n=1 Tax=Shimia sp. TaxID=1954381 RepID=UPI0032993B09